MKNSSVILIVMLSLYPAAAKNNAVPPSRIGWAKFEPIDTKPANDKPVSFRITESFLSEPGVMRRDPSDIIHIGNKYYVWYTKIFEGQVGYPGGWSGSVWYATSLDGYKWTEQHLVISAGPEEAWDGNGAYTPNILVHRRKYYLAYTAMRRPFSIYSQASIGLAISESPDGPWRKFEGNPIISPGDSLDSPDGFLTDDTVFVVRDSKIWLYYKGFPRWEGKDGRPIRAGRNTYLMVAKADKPEGPYTKDPTSALHRGHEAVVWREDGNVGSFCLGWGPARFYIALDGLHFKSMNPLVGEAIAAGIYRADFDEGSKGTRPTWGICMGADQGLARFEIVWPD
jgi:hypothetical protein